MAEWTTYFSNVSVEDGWTDTANAVDNNTGTLANATGIATRQLVLDTPAIASASGVISKVEIRMFGDVDDSVPTSLHFFPTFDGGDGDVEVITARNNLVWSDWFDITEDTNAPVGWTWTNVEDLIVNVKYIYGSGAVPNARCGSTEVRVTYTSDTVSSGSNIINYYY